MADTEIIWRGLTLGGDSPYVVTSITGWDDLADPTDMSQARVRGHGDHPGQLYSQARIVTVNGKIADGRQRDQLAAALRAVTRTTSDFSPLTIDSLGQQLTATARVLRRSLAVGEGYAVGEVPFTIQWRCPDPLRYGPPRQQSTGLPVDGGGLSWPLFASGVLDWGAPAVTGQITLINTGTAGAAIDFDVAAGAVGLPQGFEISADGQRITYPTPVPAGQTIAIDTAAGTVLAGSTADRRGELTNADWLLVPAADPDTGTTGSLTVQFTSLGAIVLPTAEVRRNLVADPQPSPAYGGYNWGAYAGTYPGAIAQSTSGSGGPTGGPFLRSTQTAAAGTQVSTFEDGTIGTTAVGPNWTAVNSTAQAHSGTHSLLCTRANVTAGNGYEAGSPFPITAGQQYQASVWVYASAGTSYNLMVQARSSTSGGTQLGAGGPTLSNAAFTPTANTWVKVTSPVVTAPAGYDGLIVYVTDDSNAAPTSGSTIYVDDVTVTALAATIGGPWCTGIPATPGQTYTASVWVRSSVAQTITPTLEWHTAGGGLSAVLASASSAPVALTANTWTRVSVVAATAPSDAASAVLTLYGPGVTTAGATVDVTMGMVEASATVGDFFDGDTSATGNQRTPGSVIYGWTGAAGASASVARAVQDGGQLLTARWKEPTW